MDTVLDMWSHVTRVVPGGPFMVEDA
jgi:hypothetical protein